MKALLTGAAVALAAGLLMGAVAKPDLAGDGRPAGPQILAGWGGGRSTGPFDDGASLANYKGQIPDYVLGTDWKRSLTPPAQVADVSPPAESRMAVIDPEQMPVTRAAYVEAPNAAPAYPSLQGGQGADPAPPAHTDAPEPGQG